MLSKLKGKKGFTLVELIVVLVILAILLAILVPSLTKWIDKAKEKQILLNARTVYLACQTVASEGYAKADFAAATYAITDGSSSSTASPAKDIVALANLKDVNYTFKMTVDDTATLATFTYTQGGKTVTLTGGALVVG